MSGQTINLASLYASQERHLREFVRRLTGNRATAEDLVQQAFLKFLSAAEGNRIDNSQAYLASIIRNLVRNHVRDLNRSGEIAVPLETLHAISDTAPSPETAAIYRCELRRVVAAVNTLPPRRREVFVLHKFQDLTYDQIAARLGISRNTVMSHIVLALADLDRLLGPQ